MTTPAGLLAPRPAGGGTEPIPRLPVATARPGGADAGIRPLVDDGPVVAWFEVGGPRRGGTPAPHAPEVAAEVVARAVAAGVEAGVPVVGVVRQAGVDPSAGVGLAHGWGRVASALVRASGLVPTCVVVDGPCLGGAALLLGLFDLVVMTGRAVVHVGTPSAATRMTGLDLDGASLGGPGDHATSSGVAHLVAVDADDALAAVADVLDLLPPNGAEPPPVGASPDPVDRPCRVAAATVPAEGRISYDVRTVLGDVVDDGHLVEIGSGFGPSIVTALGRVGGVPVGLVANQPACLAGALDIEGSQKGARFVRWCDSANLAIVTFVDTPGFRPGRDQEWRGMIRHGAQLAFAYAEATVPRVSVLVRKAYGGAFIVMDCKTMGNDCCVAWPTAEVAVMGASGAVEVLHRRRLAALAPEERAAEAEALRRAYESTHLSPRVAAERGYVDAVIDPLDTRRVVAEALWALRAKREGLVRRRHSNTPL